MPWRDITFTADGIVLPPSWPSNWQSNGTAAEKMQDLDFPDAQEQSGLETPASFAATPSQSRRGSTTKAHHEPSLLHEVVPESSSTLSSLPPAVERAQLPAETSSSTAFRTGVQSVGADTPVRSQQKDG